MEDFDGELSKDNIEKFRADCEGETVRACSPELEKLLYHPIKILCHGFIRVIDYMGNDSSIVQAARVSYGAGTKKTNEDKSLINYLMRHNHTTPFEMCEIKLHIKMPIFVARQWLRHRTASVNESSARYSIMNNEFYTPHKDQIRLQSTSNKQGRSHQCANNPEEAAFLIHNTCVDAYDNYQHLIENVGLARELARTVIPVSYYTELYWKIDLHNLMHFLKLRADSHAQYEIRCYADAILDIMKKWVPSTYDAFVNYKINAQTFSEKQLNLIKKIISGEAVSQETSGLSEVEWNEFCDKGFVK